MAKTNFTLEDYKELIARKPEKRVAEPSGDILYDKISGILIAYSKLYDLRNGWIGMITIKDAEKEIMQLINEHELCPSKT